MAEQFVAQELLSFVPQNQAPALYYWHREEKSAQAEVDFVTEYQSTVLPIEVKSQKSGSLKSLHSFLAEKEPYVPKAVKVSTSNFSITDQIISIPFYALLKLRYQLL